jgi:hypothetical protein
MSIEFYCSLKFQGILINNNFRNNKLIKILKNLQFEININFYLIHIKHLFKYTYILNKSIKMFIQKIKKLFCNSDDKFLK